MKETLPFTSRKKKYKPITLLPSHRIHMPSFSETGQSQTSIMKRPRSSFPFRSQGWERTLISPFRLLLSSAGYVLVYDMPWLFNGEFPSATYYLCFRYGGSPLPSLRTNEVHYSSAAHRGERGTLLCEGSPDETLRDLSSALSESLLYSFVEFFFSRCHSFPSGTLTGHVNASGGWSVHQERGLSALNCSILVSS